MGSPAQRLPRKRRGRQSAAQRFSDPLSINARRICFPDDDLVRTMLERASQRGVTLREEVLALCRAGLDAEANPRPPDTPLERRVRHLMQTEGLSRRAALAVARVGNHDH